MLEDCVCGDDEFAGHGVEDLRRFPARSRPGALSAPPTPPHGLSRSILVYRPNTTDHPQKGQKTRMTGKIVTVFGGSG
ncbi:MAG: hypothetical protein ABL956_17495, partial [Hyphomonadaceae bacterium]